MWRRMGPSLMSSVIELTRDTQKFCSYDIRVSVIHKGGGVIVHGDILVTITQIIYISTIRSTRAPYLTEPMLNDTR